MIRRIVVLAGVALFSFALTAAMTWPQVLHPLQVADHFDPYFSIWRLGHIAHALTRWPMHLFDGNIFFPAKNTIAYSDATLLEGLLGAPLFWLGVDPSLIYNLLLLAGFVGSGVGMFVLARHLTGAPAPSLVATAVFTMLPYRIEHIMHLELQWTMFIPLALWAVHRTMESGRWKHALLLGLFLWLQFLCCLYYGVFLALTLIVFVPLLLTFKGHVPFRVYAPRIVAGGVLAGVLTLPYVVPYFAAARDVGARPMEEISRYSAQPGSYLSSPDLNRLWGWTSDLWGAPELRLFPGLVAIVLAIAAIRHPRRRMVLLYAVTGFVVLQLSFGLNGTLYRTLLGHVSSLQGFRALARFGVFVGCALAVLAGLGTQALEMTWPSLRARRRLLTTAIVGLLVLEYSNRALPLSQAVTAAVPDAYKVLQRAAPGAIVEFPIPDPRALPGYDPYYEAWSVWHWRPMLNGYSGFYAPAYLQALPTLADFPDDDAVALLRERQVRFVIIHRSFYKQSEYTSLALRIAQQPALALWGVYKDPYGQADIVEIRQ